MSSGCAQFNSISNWKIFHGDQITSHNQCYVRNIHFGKFGKKEIEEEKNTQISDGHSHTNINEIFFNRVIVVTMFVVIAVQ